MIFLKKFQSAVHDLTDSIPCWQCACVRLYRMMNTIDVSYGLQRRGQVLDSFERSFEKSLKVIEKSLKSFSQFSQVNQKSPSLKGIKFTMTSVRFNAPA
jgi:hypothetical protein